MWSDGIQKGGGEEEGKEKEEEEEEQDKKEEEQDIRVGVAKVLVGEEEMDDLRYESSSRLSLDTFPWKVGGHHPIKLYKEESICKPLNKREARFYRQLPELLRDFVPSFQGIALDSRHGSQYLMLENLTCGYSKPCVLDLKVGTRMYGDFASQEKRRSQETKSQETTSGKLGLRVCGFQRYSQTDGAFQKVDKYMGRKADEEKFHQLLETFFTVRGELQVGVIRSLLSQCKRLRKVIADLCSIRFYSSSLLVIYEGSEDEKEDMEEPRLRLIDFANVSHPCLDLGEGGAKLHEGPDSGLLLGLDNLIKILKHLVLRNTTELTPQDSLSV